MASESAQIVNPVSGRWRGPVTVQVRILRPQFNIEKLTLDTISGQVNQCHTYGTVPFVNLQSLLGFKPIIMLFYLEHF